MDQLEKFLEEIHSVIGNFKKEIGTVRTNRPSSALVEDIKVSYYNQLVPIKHLGSIGINFPREINIQIWDENAVFSVAKAIEVSSLGLNSQIDGNIVRIFLPELSEERRQEFIKHVRKISEQYRIQLRHFRDEINKKIQKLFDEKIITEDDRFSERDKVQKIIDKANEEIEFVLNEKIKEIENK